MNRLFALFPLGMLALPLHATDPATPARVATMTIRPGEVTVLHLRPEFESTIHLPEEVTSVVLGSPGTFKAEHSEGEPNYVYVKPTRMEASQSNLLISTKTGQHVSLELINDGPGGSIPVDFLLEYKPQRSFLVSDAAPTVTAEPATTAARPNVPQLEIRPSTATPSALELEYEQQQRINTPAWTSWENKQIETSLGDVRQWENQVAVSFSVLNATGNAVEIVPPQIQLAGSTKQKKKKKKGVSVIADQLGVRDFRLSATRLEPGARADGVVLFDRPNYKQSTEKLYLQLAQADKIEQPILIRLPFTPPVAGNGR
ncbi:MAG TPA: hypothetical protein VE109_07595 [Acidobacteriaceae bacterium]|nr:hypothetical protein [Acidobacteriaceae bacterium]